MDSVDILDEPVIEQQLPEDYQKLDSDGKGEVSSLKNLIIEAAPMEGITNFIYRNIHHKYFGGPDCYFSPFIGVYSEKNVKKRDLRDVAAENNRELQLVPQVLANKAENFIWIFKKLRGLGYQEINLNLGCPSGTVTAKGRGAGFLLYPDELEEFFDQVFDTLGDEARLISVKTRIGYYNASEMERLAGIYSQFPFKQLIIHPRVRQDFYNGSPDIDAFAKALNTVSCPVCYNGNIFSVHDYEQLVSRFDGTSLSGVMLGRGLIADPSLARQIKGGKPMDVEELKGFVAELESAYTQYFGSEHNALIKVKELWTYFAWHFPGSDTCLKKLLKAKTMSEYRVQRNLIYNNYKLNI